MRVWLFALVAAAAAAAGCGSGGEDDETCTPRTCADFGAQCGGIDDGCGQSLDCGTCADGLTCASNQCTCTPRTCDDVGAECGKPSDGCGAKLDCGDCAQGETCGADGAFQCGTGSCTPRTCDDVGADCGPLDDGCANTLDCGTCPDGETCEDNACSGTCHPTTCKEAGRSCGSMDDGCGTPLNCGTCQGDLPICVEGACVMCASSKDCSDPTPNCVGGTCVACAEDADCGDPSCEAWSECVYDGDPTCDQEGTQTRACHTPVCNAGICGVKNTEETEGCGRATQGNDCGSSCGDWGSCVTGTGCIEEGTQSRACATRTCDAGACVAAEYSDTQACTEDKTDQVCGKKRCCDPETKECFTVNALCLAGECISEC